MSIAIRDASWGELTRKLAYKSTWHGRNFVAIDTWFPSNKTRSHFGEAVWVLPLSIKSWRYPSCGCRHGRNISAVLIIKAEGSTKLKTARLSASACGGLHETGVRSAAAKQEASSLRVGRSQGVPSATQVKSASNLYKIPLRQTDRRKDRCILFVLNLKSCWCIASAGVITNVCENCYIIAMVGTEGSVC